MVNKPLVRPAISRGVRGPGGRLTSHDKKSPKRELNNSSEATKPSILVVSTRLKNISQIGSFPQVGVNTQYI